MCWINFQGGKRIFWILDFWIHDMDLASRLLGGNSNKRLGSNLLRRTTNSNKQTKIQIIRNPMHIQKRVSDAAIRHITIWTHELLLLEKGNLLFLKIISHRTCLPFQSKFCSICSRLSSEKTVGRFYYTRREQYCGRRVSKLKPR